VAPLQDLKPREFLRVIISPAMPELMHQIGRTFGMDLIPREFLLTSNIVMNGLSLREVGLLSSFLLYFCSERLLFLLRFDLDNLISAEDSASLQAGLYTRFSDNSNRA
jgi:hypothetical protein